MDEFGWADMARVAAVYSAPLVAVSGALWAMFRFSFKTQNEKMDAGFQLLNDKIDSVSTTLNDKIDFGFNLLNDKIDSVSTTLNDKIDSVSKTLNDKIDSANKTLNDKIDTGFRTLSEKVDANTSSIEYLGRQVAGTKERIAHIEGKLGLPTPDPEQA